MIGLDSSKMTCYNDCLLNYSASKFDKLKRIDTSTNQEKESFILRNDSKVLGLKSLVISPNNLTIETSAKILHENYLDGLNKNTFEKFIENINAAGIVELDKNIFYDECLLHRFDVTTNIKPANKEKSLLDMKIYSSSYKYKTSPYKTGVAITGKAITKKERLIAYSKHDELSRNNKNNRDILQYINLDDTKNILRIESNYKNYNRIRSAFKLSSENNRFFLKDILKTKENPNYDIFNVMFDTRERRTKINKEKGLIMSLIEIGYKRSELEKELGKRTIIKNCDYNMELIRELLQKTSKGNISSSLKEYKNLLNDMKLESLEYDVSSLTEIKELLANC